MTSDTADPDESRRRGRPSADHGGARPDPASLAELLGEVARSLQHETDVQQTVQAIVRAALLTVPGAELASISSVADHRRVRTLAATDEVARAVDVAQNETGEGPGLDSLYQHRTVRLSDMTADGRWPEFGARAAALGIGSMLSIQLWVTGDDLGALNLHSNKPDAFDDDAENVGLLFATHASVALVDAQTEEQLRHGISTRDLIGQAKGVLMERFKITADEAFRLLVVLSQRTNRRLYDIAADLVDTGELTSH